MRKVIFSFMAIMMSVVLFSACSDKSQVLKDAVEKAKQEAGIPKTENGVTIADIRFNEATNTVEYVCELPMEVFKQFQNIAAQENYKDVFIYSKKDDASLKALAKLLLDVNGNLKFTYKTEGTDAPIELSYDSTVLKKLVDGTLPEAQLQPAQEQGNEASEEVSEDTQEGAQEDAQEGEVEE